MSQSRIMRVLRTSRLILLSAVCLAAFSYLTLTTFAPIPTTEAKLVSFSPIIADDVAIDFPKQASSGTLVRGVANSEFHDGPEEARPIASLTKLVTALVVLDKHPLPLGEQGPIITLGEVDQRLYQLHVAKNGSVTRVVPGWQFSQREMLEIILLPSSNNYADSLAVWAFGSEAAYRDAAAAWLSGNGLDNTRVVDANGLDEGNISTVADLLKLAGFVLDHPVLAEIVNLEQVKNTKLGTLKNSNILLHQYPDFSGMKTGTTSISGACLLWSVDFEAFGEKHTMIGVSLGGPSQKALAPLAYRAYQSAADEFSLMELIAAGTSVASYETVWGETVHVQTQDTLQTVVYGGARFQPKIQLPAQQQITENSKLGEIIFRFGDTEYRTGLIAQGTIHGPDFWWRLFNPDKLW